MRIVLLQKTTYRDNIKINPSVDKELIASILKARKYKIADSEAEVTKEYTNPETECDEETRLQLIDNFVKNLDNISECRCDMPFISNYSYIDAYCKLYGIYNYDNDSIFENSCNLWRKIGTTETVRAFVSYEGSFNKDDAQTKHTPTTSLWRPIDTNILELSAMIKSGCSIMKMFGNKGSEFTKHSYIRFNKKVTDETGEIFRLRQTVRPVYTKWTEKPDDKDGCNKKAFLRKAYYLGSQMITIDIDNVIGTPDINEFYSKLPLKPTICYETYSDMAAGKGKRFRLVYFLEKPIYGITYYKYAANYILEQIKNSPYVEICDVCSTTATQIMYGTDISKKLVYAPIIYTEQFNEAIMDYYIRDAWFSTENEDMRDRKVMTLAYDFIDGDMLNDYANLNKSLKNLRTFNKLIRRIDKKCNKFSNKNINLKVLKESKTKDKEKRIDFLIERQKPETEKLEFKTKVKFEKLLKEEISENKNTEEFKEEIDAVRFLRNDIPLFSLSEFYDIALKDLYYPLYGDFKNEFVSSMQYAEKVSHVRLQYEKPYCSYNKISAKMKESISRLYSTGDIDEFRNQWTKYTEVIPGYGAQTLKHFDGRNFMFIPDYAVHAFVPYGNNHMFGQNSDRRKKFGYYIKTLRLSAPEMPADWLVFHGMLWIYNHINKKFNDERLTKEFTIGSVNNIVEQNYYDFRTSNSKIINTLNEYFKHKNGILYNKDSKAQESHFELFDIFYNHNFTIKTNICILKYCYGILVSKRTLQRYLKDRGIKALTEFDLQKETTTYKDLNIYRRAIDKNDFRRIFKNERKYDLGTKTEDRYNRCVKFINNEMRYEMKCSAYIKEHQDEASTVTDTFKKFKKTEYVKDLILEIIPEIESSLYREKIFKIDRINLERLNVTEITKKLNLMRNSKLFNKYIHTEDFKKNLIQKQKIEIIKYISETKIAEELKEVLNI